MSDAKPQFVDTNILVYAYDSGAGEKHNLAKKLLNACWEHQNGCVSVQVMQEFYVNITRKAKNPLSSQQAVQIIADFSRWKVHRPDVDDVLRAIDVQTRFQISFWDAMVIQSARQADCRVLWSEDLSDGQEYDGVVVRNPFRT